MKTSLKYGTRKRLASSFNCTLVVAPDDIFIIFSAFFFFSYTLSMFLRTEVQSAPVFVRSEIQSAILLHRAIVILQFFELTSRGFAVIYRFRHVGRQSRIRVRPTLAETVTHCLVSLLEVSTFSSPFSSSSSVSCPILVLIRCCPDGSCCSSLAQSRIFCSDS